MITRKGERIYHGVINIPEGESGEYKIVHDVKPAGHEFPVISMRTKIVAGHRGAPVVYNHETRWHTLNQGEGGRWMTDLPIEQAQIDSEVADIKRGHVLIGGLGLGYVATVLAKRPQIKSVEVVEISEDVINLVAPYVCADDPAAKAKLHFTHADLFDHLKARPAGSYDEAYYDIWASDGESTFFSTVLPLFQLSNTVVRQQPICWNESVMRGQLRLGLHSRSHVFSTMPVMPEEERKKFEQAYGTVDKWCEVRNNVWTDWAVAYWRWFRKAKPERETWERNIDIYTGHYGRRGFTAYWKKVAGETPIYLNVENEALEL